MFSQPRSGCWALRGRLLWPLKPTSWLEWQLYFRVIMTSIWCTRSTPVTVWNSYKGNFLLEVEPSCVTRKMCSLVEQLWVYLLNKVYVICDFRCFVGINPTMGTGTKTTKSVLPSPPSWSGWWTSTGFECKSWCANNFDHSLSNLERSPTKLHS